MATPRNRAAGWKHAKHSGHQNEEFLKNLLETNTEYTKKFLLSLNVHDEISKIHITGIHETSVPSVLETKKTKSKSDMVIHFKTEEKINISIKKSLGGQVYLISANSFINVFEKQFSKKIPNHVQRAINLFWSSANDAVDIIKKYADTTNKKNYNRQLKHKSLNASTLNNYDPNLYNNLLEWFKENIYEITELCFSKGSAKNKEDWSHFIWYKNMLNENETDAIFSIKEICEETSKRNKDEIYFNSKNGGTTIQLPFGFVQWHQHKLQFHHCFDKINNLQTKKKNN